LAHAATSEAGEQLWAELWVSLASLLRSYTSMHGLNGNRQATVELGEERITVRHGDKWMELERSGAAVTWRREDGREGRMELMETGRLRIEDREEEMDFAANDWAMELMG
jgi:hypothetical protein